MWVKMVVKLSDDITKLLQSYAGKPITVVIKENSNHITGILIGFEGSVLLLNHIEVGSTEPSGPPIFVDIDRACIITTHLKDKGIDGYSKEYAEEKRIMKAVYAAEAT
jgi:hypothetical protein